ncbi:unnamed protein product, partial [Urochloa humidicola]
YLSNDGDVAVRGHRRHPDPAVERAMATGSWRARSPYAMRGSSVVPSRIWERSAGSAMWPKAQSGGRRRERSMTRGTGLWNMTAFLYQRRHLLLCLGWTDPISCNSGWN